MKEKRLKTKLTQTSLILSQTTFLTRFPAALHGGTVKHAPLLGIIKTVNLPTVCFMADKRRVAGGGGGGDPPPAPPLPLRECTILL